MLVRRYFIQFIEGLDRFAEEGTSRFQATHVQVVLEFCLACSRRHDGSSRRALVMLAGAAVLWRVVGQRTPAISPAEAEFYAARGAEVTWVGHPLLDSVTNLPSRFEARQRLGLDPKGSVLLLLPASRPQELRYLMPHLARAAALLQQRDPSLQVLVPAGLDRFEQPLAEALEQAGVSRGRVIAAKEADALKTTLGAAADLALGKSGTVNLELALMGVPQVVGYRVSRMTAFVARHLLRFQVDHISPVNLLLKERLVPELLQDELSAEALVAQALPLLEGGAERQRMLDGYQRLRTTLGQPGVTDRAARAILDQVSE